MVPDAQGDAENGKIVRSYRLHQRNDREPPDKERREAIRCNGRIYSEEHRRKFDIKNDIFKVERNPTDDSKLVLTINRQPIGEWFKEQFDKLRHSLRKSAEEPRKSRGFRM